MARRSAPVPRMVDLAALLLRDYELHERRSTARAKAALVHLHAYFTTVDPAGSYEATSRYVIRRRAEKAAPATIRYEISILGRALTLAARSGLIKGRPLLARPSVNNTRQGFVEIHRITPFLRALPQPERDTTEFAYITGWRRAEVLGLTWDRVHMEDGVIRLHPGTTKNRQGRTYPFRAHPRLRRLLERRLLERRGPYVFSRDHGGPLVTFAMTWKSACEKAGLGPTVCFHDLKRSAVRNLERAGVPRSVAMALVGHKTESIYRRYAITNDRDLARGVRMLARMTSRGQRAEEEDEEADDRRRDGKETVEGRRREEAEGGDASGC